MGVKNEINYGHQGLSVVAGIPHTDPQEILRELSRKQIAAGSASGGFGEDSNSILAAINQSAGNFGTICCGLVHQIIPGLLVYRVALDGYRGEIICGDLFGSGRPHSVKFGCVYPVGSRVIVFQHNRSDYGTILGFASDPAADKNFEHSISGKSEFHYNNRVYIRSIITNPDLGKGLPNYLQGRPVDLCDGDYVITNMLGGGFHTDAFQTSIRQSPDCGLWLFTMDRLLRLVGRSIQEFSFAHERYIGADEQEVYGFEGMAMYPWEAYGFFKQPNELYEKSKGFLKLKNDKSVPFYRTRRYSGFIGQGILQEVLVPPKNVNGDNPFTSDSNDIPICVSREQALLDGTLLFESANAIHLVKHANIRTFKRINAIDNPQGDDTAGGDYPFSQSPAPPDRPNTNTSVTDQILWSVRKQAGAAFAEHKKDFRKIEPDQQIFEKDVNVGKLESLKQNDHITNPPLTDLFVDERYKNIKINGSRASISLLPDGGIALRGSCGEEILLQGGNITLSAPGDIRIMPARSVVSLAGDDVVFRAKNSIDITATDNDVRIKAEKNLDMVGGMSGTGRTLLENKAESFPSNKDVQNSEGESISGHGLIFRARESMVGIFAKQIYARSLERGNIYLDADHGNGNIKSVASQFDAIAASAICFGVGVIAEQPEQTQNKNIQTLLAVTSTAVTVSSSLRVFENAAVQGRVSATQGCNANPSTKPVFDDNAVQSQNNNIENFQTRTGDALNSQFYAEDKIGTDDAIKNYTFSYRTSSQCGSGRFEFKEPYWMELYGEGSCSAFVMWDEPIYKYREEVDQLPWPGYDAWAVNPSVVKNNTQLYDAESGLDKDDAELSTGTAGDGEKVIPADFFRVSDPN
jgi:hypothetical protein